MRQWEYRTSLLHAEERDMIFPMGWKLRQINEQEIPNWKRTERFASIATYCNFMDEKGWELVSTVYREPSAMSNATVVLLFKRLYADKIDRPNQQK